MIYKLGEICDFYNGGAWSDKEYVTEGIPVLKVTNCKPRGFQIEDINYLPFSAAAKYAKNKLQIGDVVIATVGSHPNLVDSAAGRACIINSEVVGFYLNQNAVCIRSKNRQILDQRYLGYLSKYRPFQHYIQMRGRGAANQMRIAIGAIKSYEIELPQIDLQHKISNMLSTYDDLIENNQKQIKLLEEAAQRLYKEWFVDLHFPGHEHTKIVDGLPAGWKKGTLVDIAIFKRGKTITKSQAHKGVVPVVAGGKEPAYYHDRSNTEAPVITVSASGNAGYVRLYYQSVWASDCSFLDNEKTRYLYFVYAYLKHNQDDIYALQKGACQQHVNAKEINALEMTVPTEEIMERFCNIVSHNFENVRILQRQNELLAQARDRLLPKLMSGELEV